MTFITRIFLALTSLHVLCCQAGVIEYLFGSTDAICYNTTKVEFEKVCEPFKKRTCYTENSETCAPVEYKNCTGVVETKAERACFNVSEIFCDLHESIHLEHTEETYQLMHCFVAVDRVCDTVYRIETKTEDEYHCIDVEAPKCFQRVYTINDISCTDSVEFNCQSFDFDWMSKGGGRDVVCARFPRKQCHKVPRKVLVELCEMKNHQYCEKFSNVVPYPVEEQNCHFEPKRICEIQEMSRPKKVKKYSYIEECVEEERELCGQVEKRNIIPICSIQERLECEYVPKESCNIEEEEKCAVIEIKNVVEVCENNSTSSPS